MQTLRQLAAQVRHRMQVYETLGLRRQEPARPGRERAVRRARAEPARRWRRKCSRANWPRPLPHRPLAVVSKYIGETEKNLRQVFDAGEQGGVDPPVRRGRRAVRQAERGQGQPRPLRQHRGRLPAPAHGGIPGPRDPHHQPEVSARPGVPAPPAVHRHISRSPTRRSASRSGGARSRTTPPAAGLDLAKLAQLNMAGGNIRNIATQRGVPRGGGRPADRDGARARRGPARGREARAAAVRRQRREAGHEPDRGQDRPDRPVGHRPGRPRCIRRGRSRRTRAHPLGAVPVHGAHLTASCASEG